MPVIFLCLALMLFLWGARQGYKRIWKKGLEVELAFQEQPSMEGETASFTEVIRNRKRFPVPLLHVKFETSRWLDFYEQENVTVSDRSYKNDLFAVMPYQQIRRTLSFICRKRGYYCIERAELVSSFLFFRDFEYERRPADTAIYVYPRRLHLAELDVFLQQLTWTLSSRKRLYEDPFSFAGIREYQPYDPQKSINWMASAKTGQLMVNIREYTAGQPVVILVNLETSVTWHTDALLEESIRLAVTAAARLMESGIPVSVWTTHDRGGLPMPEASEQALAQINRRLAVLDIEARGMSYAEWLETRVLPVYDEKSAYLVISYEERTQMQAATEALAARQGELWLIEPYFEGENYPLHSQRIHQMERAVNWHEQALQ